MRIPLTKSDKVELLKAIQKGELDTNKIPSLFQCLQGANAFEELMKSLPDEESPPPENDSLTMREYSSLYDV